MYSDIKADLSKPWLWLRLVSAGLFKTSVSDFLDFIPGKTSESRTTKARGGEWL